MWLTKNISSFYQKGSIMAKLEKRKVNGGKTYWVFPRPIEGAADLSARDIQRLTYLFMTKEDQLSFMDDFDKRVREAEANGETCPPFEFVTTEVPCDGEYVLVQGR